MLAIVSSALLLEKIQSHVSTHCDSKFLYAAFFSDSVESGFSIISN
jgi:hypothetical protein